MRRVAVLFLGIITVAACEKRDPILPGIRTDIFDTGNVVVHDTPVPALPENYDVPVQTDCPYTRDTKNNVWNGDKKVFAGFPTTNSVRAAANPVCSGTYVYTGLSTGELVKINPTTRSAVWVADIFRPSNMTGGAALVDIIVAPVIHGGYVYVGGLGDALCKINATTGTQAWCAPIGIAHDFIVMGNVIFAVATDGHLYAINTKNGDAYWRHAVKKMTTPTYANKIITVGRERFDAETGKYIK